MQVSKLGYTDLEWIDDIVEMTHEFAGESSIYQNLGFNKEKFRGWLIGSLQGGAVCLMVHDEIEAYGYCLFYIEADYIDRCNMEIVTIYVKPEGRSKGLARKLVQSMVNIQDINNIPYAQVSICAMFEENAELINKLTANVFAKQGYKNIGLIMGRRGDSWADCLAD